MKRIQYYRLPIPRLIPCPMRPDEIRHVRRLWWRQRHHESVELPAEKGVILIRGGKP